MIDKRFAIEMQTILGKKTGELYFNEENGIIDGFFDILHRNNLIHGESKENGEIEFTGEITTLIRKIPFYAEGKISGRKINLILKSENDNFSVIGTEV